MSFVIVIFIYHQGYPNGPLRIDCDIIPTSVIFFDPQILCHNVKGCQMISYDVEKCRMVSNKVRFTHIFELSQKVLKAVE